MYEAWLTVNTFHQGAPHKYNLSSRSLHAWYPKSLVWPFRKLRTKPVPFDSLKVKFNHDLSRL